MKNLRILFLLGAALAIARSAARAAGRDPAALRYQTSILSMHLTDRPGHRCDAPGQEAAAIFKVVDGKIVLWHQTAPPPSTPSGPTI